MSPAGGAAARGPWRIASAALCALVVAWTGRASAEDYGPDLENHLQLIERYQSGDFETPVRAVVSWGPIWIRSTSRRLLDWCQDAPGGATAVHVRAAQGAFLLHTHAALAGRALGLRTPDHEEHVEAALQLLRWFRKGYREGSWPREARGLRPRDFYLALVSAEVLMQRPVTARTLAEESLRNEGHDPAMRLLVGCALETEAAIRRQSEGDWPDKVLREAERRFGEVLDEAPTLLEARLRLGWVLVRRGKAEKAQPFLETVADTPGDPGRRALAARPAGLRTGAGPPGARGGGAAHRGAPRPRPGVSAATARLASVGRRRGRGRARGAPALPGRKQSEAAREAAWRGAGEPDPPSLGTAGLLERGLGVVEAYRADAHPRRRRLGGRVGPTSHIRREGLATANHRQPVVDGARHAPIAEHHAPIPRPGAREVPDHGGAPLTRDVVRRAVHEVAVESHQVAGGQQAGSARGHVVIDDLDVAVERAGPRVGYVGVHRLRLTAR